MLHMVTTRKNVTAQQVFRLYYDNIYRLHGLPKAINSDHDTKFTSDFYRDSSVTIFLYITLKLTEKPNEQRVFQALCNHVNRAGSNWAKFVTTVEFAINSVVNMSTGKVLFEIIYCYLPRILPPVIHDDTPFAPTDFVESQMLHLLEIQDAIVVAKTEQSERTNRNQVGRSVCSSVGRVLVWPIGPDLSVGLSRFLDRGSVQVHSPVGHVWLHLKICRSYALD